MATPDSPRTGVRLNRSRAGGLLAIAGNGLILLSFAGDPLGLQGSSEFGWEQSTAALTGTAMAVAGAVCLALPRTRAGFPTAGKRALVNLLELGALSAMAIAQPLFDLLANNAEFFVARHSPAADVVLFTLVLVVLPPVLLVAIELLAGVVNIRAQQALHVAFVGALVALLLMNALSDVDTAPAGVVLAVAAYAGAAAALAYVCLEAVRLVVRVLAPTPVLFAALFVLSSDISEVAFPDEAEGRSARSASRAPVVMVVFDEFQTTLMLKAPGEIDARRFPNFARFARTANWYPNATAVSDMTTRAVPAILTGEYARAGTLPIASDHPDNLFTLLDDTHRMDVREDVTQLCTGGVCGQRDDEPFSDRMRSLASDIGVIYRHLVLPEGLRQGLPDITTTLGEFEGAVPATEDRLLEALHTDRAAVFGRFVAGIAADEEPTLHFLHLMLPHLPLEFLSSGQRYARSDFAPGPDADGRWVRGEQTRFLYQQRVLLQTRYVDRLLGLLIERLHETGLFDEAVIVLVADHGASVLEGDERRRVTESNIGGILPVPLFIKAPGQREGRVVDAHVRVVDVLPTIARLLDSQIPWKTDGRPLVGERYPEPDRLRFLRDVEGDEISIPVTTLERARAEVLARQLDAFGTGDVFPGRAGIYGYGSLIGRRLAEIPARPGGPRGVLELPELFEDVDTDAAALPAYVTGHLEGVPAGAPRDVAVSVNGRVETVTRTFALGEWETFAVMIRPASLRDGRNNVRVIAIGGDAGRIVLETPSRRRAARGWAPVAAR